MPMTEPSLPTSSAGPPAVSGRTRPPEPPREDLSRRLGEGPDIGAIWALEPPAVHRALRTSPAGLASADAAVRLREYGPNEIPRPRRRPLVLRFVDQLVHFMALLLWVGGILAFVSRMPELGWAIWAVIWINATFSFWQEYRAERALDELTRMLPVQARVRRDGEPGTIPARELVPGDVLLLEEGDRISADARLVWAALLTVDLSVLTGESVPIERRSEPVPAAGAGRADRLNLVLAGTTVATGRGTAVVYATGARTEFGRVAHLTATIQREPSTLEAQVARIASVISALAIGIGVAVFVLSELLVGLRLSEAFIFSIGIIVANVPEGLLPTVTLSLAMGVRRMARRHALVRRLSAVEELSATTVICTDKTGTLTKSEMTVTAAWTPDATGVLTGAGYRAEGELRTEAHGEGRRSLDLLLAGAALCANAHLREGERGAVTVLGDPTEAALLVAAAKVGHPVERLAAGATRRREVPFDARRKRMTVVLRWGLPDLWLTGAPYVAIAKGAPTAILDRCVGFLAHGDVRPLGEAEREEILAANDRLAASGLRILGVAFREGGSRLLEADPAELESELVFVGLVAMHDPPRPEVAPAIAACRRAGIRVTMVTGDDGNTALAIGRRIGLVADDAARPVVTGAQLDDLSEAALREILRADEVAIFARTTPEQKLRLVRAYQGLDHVVAVTGDGVNDAPALRAAHIGIAMGLSGTDVAREAADIVLLDDDFATIVAAIEQSRAIYRNIRKFMTYILASNVPEIVPFIAMVALRIPPALTIMQILAVDLGTDMVPALGLGAEPPEPGLMDEPPRPKSAPLLDAGLLARAYGFLGVLEGIASMAAFGAVWWLHGYDFAAVSAAMAPVLARTADPVTANVYAQATTAALAAIVACQVGNLFVCRTEGRFAWPGWAEHRLIWSGIAVETGLLAAIVWFPPLQGVVSTAPLAPLGLLAILVVGPAFMIGSAALARTVGPPIGRLIGHARPRPPRLRSSAPD